jgi:hypothetical protein
MDTKNYDLTITQNFCNYFVEVCGSNRPVQPKEVWMLYEYFKLCQREGITVDSAYIKKLAKSLQFSNGDFNAILLANTAKTSYQKWFLKNKPNPDGTLWGISYPEYRLGITFFIKQVAKNFTGIVPVGNPFWDVPVEDLL